MDFPRWLQYHRKHSGKLADGSTLQEAEIAGEEWMMEVRMGK